MVSPATLETFSAEIRQANLIVSPITLEDMRQKETFFGFSKKHNLGISQAVITKKIKQAYQDGLFNPSN
jgi:polar amino acid transport system substrate-binding protein